MSSARQHGDTAVKRHGAGAPDALPALDADTTLAVLRASHDLVLLLDANGRIEAVWSSDESLEAGAREHWLGRDWAATVTIECLDKVAQMLRDASDPAHPPRPRQINHQLPGRSDWPVHYTPVRLERPGRAPQVLALGRDLSGLMHTQQRMVQTQQAMERDYGRLREAQARYRHLFQNCNEAVVVVDGRSGRVSEANPAALALLSATANKLVDHAFAALFEPGEESRLREAMVAARRFGPQDEGVPGTLARTGAAVEVWFSAFAQDEAEYLLVRLLPMPAAAPAARGAKLFALNGHGHASAEAQLQWPYGAFWHASREALVLTDAQGRVRDGNRAFLRLAEFNHLQQAQQHSLDRWLGRTGVEMGVMLSQLRDATDGGETAPVATTLTTEWRGEHGRRTPVVVQGFALPANHTQASPWFAFSIREDNAAEGVHAGSAAGAAASAAGLSSRIPQSSEQIGALIGRVPLKQIIAESSDLIERMSIQSALHITRDNRVLAAQLLGLSRQSLYVKMRRFGLGDLPQLGDDLDEAPEEPVLKRSARADKPGTRAAPKTLSKTRVKTAAKTTPKAATKALSKAAARQRNPRKPKSG